MNKPKISVIIPVYNTGALLNRTLASVTQQKLADLEIICVDDGSTDDSLSILRTWANNDPRVRLIPLQQNGGVAHARNLGIDESRGEYVYFLDSDDWIDDDYLDAMYAQARETGQDVVVNANYIMEYEEPGKMPKTESWGIFEPGFYPTEVVQSHMLCVMWLRLYKREFLVRNAIRFPAFPCGEDIYFTGLCEVLQQRSYVFFGPYHHYWQRAGSLAHRNRSGFYYVQIYRMLYDDLKDRGLSLHGLKLFPSSMIEVDTLEKFDYIRSYAQEIYPLVQEHPELYTRHDALLLDAVFTCPDYDTFRADHHSNIAIDFLRNQLKNRNCNG